METKLIQCAVCGAEIDYATGLCPYCPPASTTPPSPAAGPSAPLPASPTPEATPDPAVPAAALAPAVPAAPAPPAPAAITDPLPLASAPAPAPAAAPPTSPPVPGPAPVLPVIAKPVVSASAPPLDRDLVADAAPAAEAAMETSRPLVLDAASAPPWTEGARRPPPGPASEEERQFGLLLFEAEECLSRGQAEKAAVLASRAVRENPQSLTARALFERSRRDLLKGRRREKLEARLREAQALLERGEFDAAEKIVGSALKLVPSHQLALELFGKLKERRLGAGTAEADAERDLDRLARAQAAKAADAARSALKLGWERKALLALRRGLRLAPDDPDLLALHREVESSFERREADRVHKHALHAQVRAGLDLLEGGEIERARETIREALREDPENVRAQAAIQEVRRAWLARSEPPEIVRTEIPDPIVITPTAPAAPRPFEPARAPAAPERRPPPPERRPTAPPERAAPSPGPSPERRPLSTAMPVPASAAVALPPATARPTMPPRPASSANPRSVAVPQEILLPRTRRRATPIGLILGCAAALLVVVFLALRSSGPEAVPAPGKPSSTSAAVPALPAPSVAAAATGTDPLAHADPDLRRAIEQSLSAYQRALESADAALLAQTRPDLSAEDRARHLAPFVGAVNAASDIRVLDVVVEGDTARVPILRTDVIIGGKVPQSPPTEETLRFRRRAGEWSLR